MSWRLSLCRSAPNLRPQAAQDDFANWPAGTSPRDVGRRVAENFVARPFERPTGFIIYPEVCAWYGALTLASLTGDTDLRARLVRKFELLLTPEGSNHISPEAHVDFRVFGGVPLEIFRQARRECSGPAMTHTRRPGTRATSIIM